MFVEVRRDTCFDVRLNQFLKAFHNHWGESNWPVIIHASNSRGFVYRDYSSSFQTGGDSDLP